MSRLDPAAFQALFNALDAGNLERLGEVYAEHVLFEDPLHRVEGLPALTEYFRRMYRGVVEIRFDFDDVMENTEGAMLTWVMHMRHARLRPGELLSLPGASVIKFEERVHYHRDYFDVGAMLYERLPVIGGVIRKIKARV